MRPTEDDLDEGEVENENEIINEEYKTWKKNAPFLYDVVITHALLWPSLTCQWFPDKTTPPDKPYSVHRLLLGTHTSGQSQDYLQIATVHLPLRGGQSSSDKVDRSSYDDELGELGGHSIPVQPKIQITQKMKHQGEVNRARYMPQNPDLLATKTISGEVCIWDRTRHPNNPDASSGVKPDMRLLGQSKEGFGLSWNPIKSGHILAGSEDMTVCHWDVNSYQKGKPGIQPVATYDGHTSIVGDVDWHASRENIFASVGDDRKLMIWDTRTPKDPVFNVEAHDREILSVAFSPASENLIITGSSDKTVALFDTRSLSKRLHTFESHAGEVLHLAWSPMNPTVFASAGSDRRINIWDLSQIGVEQTPEDAEDGPPELMFMHGGHTSRPADFSWAPGDSEPWHLASVSEDNIVMVWQPSIRIWAGEEVHINEDDLESNAMEGVQSTSNAAATAEGS